MHRACATLAFALSLSMSHNDDDDDDMEADEADEQRLRQTLATKDSRPRIQYGSLDLQATAASTQPTAAQSSPSDGLLISQSTLNADMQAGRSIAASTASPPTSSSSPTLLDLGKAAGHINIAAAGSGQYELSESGRIEHEKQAAVLRDMEVCQQHSARPSHSLRPLTPLCHCSAVCAALLSFASALAASPSQPTTRRCGAVCAS